MTTEILFLCIAGWVFHALGSIELAKAKCRKRSIQWRWGTYFALNLYDHIYSAVAAIVVVVYAKSNFTFTPETAFALTYSASTVLDRLTKRAKLFNE